MTLLDLLKSAILLAFPIDTIFPYIYINHVGKSINKLKNAVNRKNI